MCGMSRMAFFGPEILVLIPVFGAMYLGERAFFHAQRVGQSTSRVAAKVLSKLGGESLGQASGEYIKHNWLTNPFSMKLLRQNLHSFQTIAKLVGKNVSVDAKLITVNTKLLVDGDNQELLLEKATLLVSKTMFKDALTTLSKIDAMKAVKTSVLFTSKFYQGLCHLMSNLCDQTKQTANESALFAFQAASELSVLIKTSMSNEHEHLEILQRQLPIYFGLALYRNAMYNEALHQFTLASVDFQEQEMQYYLDNQEFYSSLDQQERLLWQKHKPVLGELHYNRALVLLHAQGKPASKQEHEPMQYLQRVFGNVQDPRGVQANALVECKTELEPQYRQLILDAVSASYNAVVNLVLEYLNFNQEQGYIEAIQDSLKAELLDYKVQLIGQIKPNRSALLVIRLIANLKLWEQNKIAEYHNNALMCMNEATQEDGQILERVEVVQLFHSVGASDDLTLLRRI